MKFLNHIIAVLVFATLLSACKDKVVKEKSEVIRPVRYELVRKMNAQKVLTFNGVAEAGDKIELSFRSGGILTRLNVKRGQKVKKGDLLARLDNVQANLAYDQSVSALSAAQSAMNTSKSNLQRSKALYEKGSQSLSDYENAKNSFQGALDQFESAKRDKELKKSQISYGYIYAPKNGVVADKNGSINEYITSGQVVVVLNAGTDMQVNVGIPGSIINEVKLGMQTGLMFSSLESKNFEGIVIEISPMVNVNAATFPVKIEITDPTKEIRSGMIVDVIFTFGDRDTTKVSPLIIPVISVGEDGNGNFVFVIEQSDSSNVGIAKKHTIELGEITNLGFIVKTGLKEGDKIATAGLQSLLDGQKVKLQ